MIAFLELRQGTSETIQKVLKERLLSPALLIAFSFASGFCLVTSPLNLLGIFETKKNHKIEKRRIKAFPG